MKDEGEFKMVDQSDRLTFHILALLSAAGADPEEALEALSKAQRDIALEMIHDVGENIKDKDRQQVLMKVWENYDYLLTYLRMWKHSDKLNWNSSWLVEKAMRSYLGG